MNTMLRSRARWSFAGTGITLLLTVVVGFLTVFRIGSPFVEWATPVLGLSVIGCYFSGLSAMLRLKGFAVWKGVILAVLLAITSSAVRVLYRPAQPVV
ncbi:MAG: hypothetical protein H8F28_09030 [Fibrella sp.]|nr:hypothetical protein [Armatimonadota bacterium]